MSRTCAENQLHVPADPLTARRVRRVAALSIVLLAACLVSPRLTRALGILPPYGTDWLYLFIALLGASSLAAVAMAVLILRHYRAVSSVTKLVGAFVVAIHALLWALVLAFLFAGPM